MKWPDSTEVVYKAWKAGGTVSNGGVGKHEITKLLKLFSEQTEYQEWKPEFYEYLKQEDKKIDEDYQRAFLHPETGPAMTGPDLENYVVSPEVLYRNDYPYESSTTKTGRKHWEAFAERTVSRFNLINSDLVVDIGSNVGVLIEFFK